MVRLSLQRTDRAFPEVVKQAGELAKAGKYEEAKMVIEKKLEEAEDVQVYLPFGDLHLDFVEDNYGADEDTFAGASPDSDTSVTDYERCLDLDRAVAF